MRKLISLLLLALLPACSHGLSISTRPEGATVKLYETRGDKVIDLGETPVNTTVMGTGEYTISIDKRGYTPQRKTIDLGSANSYQFDLVPVYNFDINSDPPGADIILLDETGGRTFNLGRAPVKRVIEGYGPYTVKARLEGYKTTEQQIETVHGESAVNVTVVLTR